MTTTVTIMSTESRGQEAAAPSKISIEADDSVPRRPAMPARAQSAHTTLYDYDRTRVYPSSGDNGNSNGLKTASSVNSVNRLASSSSLCSMRSADRSWPDFGSIRAARDRVFTSGITFSEAKGEIYKERLHGALLKRGFRHRRLWIARWVVLTGRMITYFESVKDETKTHNQARGALELTADTVVSYEEDDNAFGFVIFPRGNKKMSINSASLLSRDQSSNSNSVARMPIARSDESSSIPPTVLEENDEDDYDATEEKSFSFLSCGSSIKPHRSSSHSRSEQQGSIFQSLFPWLWCGEEKEPEEEIWCFRAKSAQERELWVKAIQRIVALIQRVEMAPTLVGVGSINNHYELKHDIGVGRFGTVKLAVARGTGRLFAVKVLHRPKNEAYDAAVALTTEMRVVRKVTRMHDHPNICKTFHTFTDSINNTVHIVMEYLAGGSLADRIRKKGCFSEPEASSIIFQIASALKELHSSNIVLCDINPGNLLFESVDSDVVKVVEFGRALILPSVALAGMARAEANNNGEGDGRRGRNILPHSSFLTKQQVIGQPGYVAPEIQSHKQYSTACDVFSLGCVAFTMLMGVSPLLGSESVSPSRASMDQVLSDASMSLEVRDLIAGMANPDRSKRLTAAQVLEHVWVLAPPRSSTDADNMQGDSAIVTTRPKLWPLFNAILVAVRLLRSVRRARGESEVVKAQPPPALIFSNNVELHRSDSSSGGDRLGQLERRNQILTLDGFAQRVRSENRLDDLSPIFRGPNGRVNSSASGFAGGIGISSSIAGQLSELGADSAEPSREPVRPAGPFLAALEAHLILEAGYDSSTDEDASEDDQLLLRHGASSASSLRLPQRKQSHASTGSRPSALSASANRIDEEDEEVAAQSPKTRRAVAYRAWEEMVRINEQQNQEEAEAQRHALGD